MLKKIEMVALLGVILILFGTRSAEAIFDAPIVEIPPDTLANGNLLEGVGFSALRAEDKKRLKRLRERYLELNPPYEPDIKLFDIDTPTPAANIVE